MYAIESKFDDGSIEITGRYETADEAAHAIHEEDVALGTDAPQMRVVELDS